MKKKQQIGNLNSFVFVKGGTFYMGDMDAYWRREAVADEDETPIHEVYLDDFHIGKYPVTQKEWVKIMGSNPSRFKGDDLPVENVSWNDVQGFIKKLNHLTGGKYRLSTEAEWEYAARSGGKAERWAGTSNESELGDYAWHDANSDSKTHHVGQKKPNGLGLYDMSGNIWEWCSDLYDKDYYKNSPKGNPKGPNSGEYRVLRGGSWLNNPENLRAANRIRSLPGNRGGLYGFRLVVSSVR